jgi:hypothetical protein
MWKLPFKPGISGNPGGRPKWDTSLTGLLRRELGKREEGEETATRKQRLTNKLIELALNGDPVCIKYIFDRVDGKPTETIRADVKNNMIFDNAAAIASKLEEQLLNDNGAAV